MRLGHDVHSSKIAHPRPKHVHVPPKVYRQKEHYATDSAIPNPQKSSNSRLQSQQTQDISHIVPPLHKEASVIPPPKVPKEPFAKNYSTVPPPPRVTHNPNKSQTLLLDDANINITTNISGKNNVPFSPTATHAESNPLQIHSPIESMPNTPDSSNSKAFEHPSTFLNFFPRGLRNCIEDDL